jgi:4-amino-4-deoxy-L-arabinose transferase-like glycosyltransferase
MKLSLSQIRWALWIAAGVLLRVILIAFPRPSDDDTGLYLELGSNLLHHGVYGMTNGSTVTPSLLRLPGYPLILAVTDQLFGGIWPHGWLNVLFLLQAAADVAGGLLLAAFARRFISGRAAEAALALTMLCPLTAAYAGIAMTECLSVFAVSLGIYAAGRAIAAARADGRDVWAIALAGCAAGLATLLRPDGTLLVAALAAGIFGYTLRGRAARHGWRAGLRSGMASAALFCVVALAPIVPWTVRNWTAFHVFEPLAPRHANDPGERVNLGFSRWVRTWSVEYSTTDSVIWNVGSENIDIDDLPARAFDSAEQREQTKQMLDEYNRWNGISPELDERFAALAAERIRTHPLRYYVVVPMLRVADMALRPRTEAFYLDISWWLWREHPGQTIFSLLLALINLGYVGLAAWGFLRGRVPLAWMLGGYLALRCLLLGTMEGGEPRYTLEWFPILIVAAAAAIGPRLARNSKSLAGLR